MTARLDAIGLVARDLATTLSFYRLLGLDIPPEADLAEHVEVPLPGGLRLLVDPVSTIAGFDPSFDPDGDLGGTTLAFSCDDPADVDRVHGGLIAAGHRSHLDPFDAPWGQRYATVYDPEGNHIDLFAPLG
jgi:catechol 2,3-dioxygenase-like lactoylglutathione lyase family enzyme